MRTLWLAALVLISGLLIACSEENDASPDVSLEVTGHGFYLEPAQSPDEYNVYYAVTFQNNEASVALVGGDYEVTFYDSNGDAVGKDARDFSVVLPGQEIAKASKAGAISEPASMEVEINIDETQGVEDVATLLPLDGTYEPEPEIGSSTVTAQLSNPYPVTLREVEVVAVFRDGSGAITGGWPGFAAAIPAEQETEVSINVIAQPPTEPATVEVYPSVSRLSFPELLSDNEP